MNAEYERYRALVEEALKQCLPTPVQDGAKIVESARYSLMAGGKRLRPCLVLAAAERVGVEVDEAMAVACAIEMIHTYSLIHDDLPAMDNDTLRRGRPTNHVVYGEAMAILAGDGLLTHAFAHMTTHALRYPAHAQAHLRAIARVADAAGLEGMVAGQSLDVLCEKQGVQPGREREQLDYIHRNKTAAMIRGALLAGAELGSPDTATLQAFSDYGEKLGLAFQVADDLLDACSTTEEMGKTVGKDAQEGKLTYVSLYGMERSAEVLETLTREAVEAIRPVDADGFFAQLAWKFAARTH